jgi:hypothetical protein
MGDDVSVSSMCLYYKKEKNMETTTAKNYEEIMMQRYSEDCGNWKPENGGFPQIAFYGFHKSYGYVTYDLEIHSACWRKTKSESITAFKKMTGKE